MVCDQHMVVYSLERYDTCPVCKLMRQVTHLMEACQTGLQLFSDAEQHGYCAQDIEQWQRLSREALTDTRNRGG